MPTYKLYAPEASFRAFAPLIAAEYNNVDVEVSTDLSAAAKSPVGKLPLLEISDNTVIFSSHAMARYLAAVRRDTGLMGQSLAEAAAIENAKAVKVEKLLTLIRVAELESEYDALTQKYVSDYEQQIRKSIGSTYPDLTGEKKKQIETLLEVFLKDMRNLCLSMKTNCAAPFHLRIPSCPYSGSTKSWCHRIQSLQEWYLVHRDRRSWVSLCRCVCFLCEVCLRCHHSAGPSLHVWLDDILCTSPFHLQFDSYLLHTSTLV